MTKNELIALARLAAVKHHLDEALVCAICEQESSWNPWAMRYEPSFFARYVAPLYTQKKIAVTEAYARGFSWGLMQVMGQVARENGFEGQFLSELCEPAIGLEIGCKVFFAKLGRQGGDTTKALQSWNGGGNPDYATEVLARIPTYNPDTAAQSA
jgi:soluble lytic murein transglycosylase-like protein